MNRLRLKVQQREAGAIVVFCNDKNQITEIMKELPSSNRIMQVQEFHSTSSALHKRCVIKAMNDTPDDILVYVVTSSFGIGIIPSR